ncbi:DUF185-domain-containing protein [Coprinopsis marcescibilis]|uniref:Protein arginine methyltransferase NDUFAF7 n=1 Tax=Coprinopsis marcescibilis TaxID=230819 RepID=A0A5C3L540_COPMA|nr:DUF185-domain-containing protein [Coprinopsis marcescibilis]
MFRVPAAFGAISRQCRRPLSQWNSRLNHNVASERLLPVQKIILGDIKATGPISFAKYMQLCLSHPTHGYYMNPGNPVFGASGDFITSPEISQVFGEWLLGIWFMTQWANAGRPKSVRMVELGPGRGTLMDDMLRIVTKFLPTQTLKSVHLVETSQALRAVQQTTLGQTAKRDNYDLHWHDRLSEIPREPSEYTMLVAHEFFDALPVHIIQRTETGWNEVLIASAATETGEVPETGPLRRVLAPLPSAVSTLLGNSSQRFRNLPVGSTIEVTPASFRIAHQIGRLLSDEDPLSQTAETGGDKGVGGCGLIIDYGGDHAYEDSFRAFKDHEIVDVFHRPGDCDLTANVDFAYLKEAMTGLVTSYGPIPQADFLDRMGLRVRAEALARSAASEERRKVIHDAVKRLADRNAMGNQYQILGVSSSQSTSEADTWPFVVEPKPATESEPSPKVDAASSS